AQGHRARRVRQVGEAHHAAALLVDAQQQLRPGQCPRLGDEYGDLEAVRDVAAEQADAAGPALAEERAFIGSERRPAEVDHDQARWVQARLRIERSLTL